MTGWYRRGGKRLFDLLLAGFGGLLFAIPFAWIAWQLSRQWNGSPLFRQARIGRGGRMFLILKFRTMSQKGEIPPFCQRLRASAMDELPQLIHILRGEMSFVGPRPLIPEELTLLPSGTRRLQVRPGLTGLAQLYSDKVPTLAERLHWDLEYVDRCSFSLDLRILFQSIWVTIQGTWERKGPKMAAKES